MSTFIRSFRAQLRSIALNRCFQGSFAILPYLLTILKGKYSFVKVPIQNRKYPSNKVHFK